MRKSDLLTLLALRCGNRTDADIIQVLELELTLAQDTILEQNGRFKPWFMIGEKATTSTIPNEQRVELPADFLGEIEEGALYVLNPESGKFNRLVRDDYDFLHDKFKDTNPTLPTYYVLEDSKYYRLFPTPDLEYVLMERYYERDTAFSDVGEAEENRWLRFASDLLLAIGGEQYASKHLQNPGLAAGFQADGLRAWDRLKREHEMREHTNRDYEMGD